MTDDRTGRELAPRTETQITPNPSETSVDRFTAGPAAHTVGLTEERAAQIVKQSGSARNVAFLAVLIVALFVPIYWFYDIGIPALGVESRFEKEANAQYVTDVKRGYALYLANCARCHGDQGQGGIGPPFNNQAKLYNALTAAGLSGTGHLNPNYIKRVLEVGGRYVCGDAKSAMPAWAQPAGPLNYREVEELIAWLTASTTTEFEYVPVHVEGAVGPAASPVLVHGWRDPTYSPAPNPSPVPACWRNPSGVIGGGGGTTPTAAPIGSPGTVESPRVIAVNETVGVTITDPTGNKLAAIAVVPGETVKFQVTNTAGFDHNFYVGAAALLKANTTTGLQGVPVFTTGTKEFTYTVPQTDDGTLEFACTLPFHYDTMHGPVQLQAGGVPAASGAPSVSPAPSAPGSAAPSAAPGSPAPSP